MFYLGKEVRFYRYSNIYRFDNPMRENNVFLLLHCIQELSISQNFNFHSILHLGICIDFYWERRWLLNYWKTFDKNWIFIWFLMHRIVKYWNTFEIIRILLWNYNLTCIHAKLKKWISLYFSDLLFKNPTIYYQV